MQVCSFIILHKQFIMYICKENTYNLGQLTISRCEPRLAPLCFSEFMYEIESATWRALGPREKYSKSDLIVL